MPMSSSIARRRGRTLVALASSLGLLLGAAALTSPPAGSAPPLGDCTPAFPLAEVAAGQLVEGLTVDSGVTPEPFTGEVLGVLEGGVAAGVDMIIMELDSPAIRAAGGIWQGMSGSPVYDATDGRLLGAVAYGLSYGASPVAGITPFEDMDDYLASAARRPARVEIGRAMARRIAARSDVTAREAAQGARQLPMPLGVSGLSARRLAIAKKRPYVTKDSYAVGRAASAAVPEDIVAGGNIAASYAYGDITAAGVGTATQVCDGRVVGFGHPMIFLGPTTLAMHPAEAIYVQPESLGSPFKVANVSAPAGTITDDRLTGITGSYGELPEALTVTSDVTMGSRHRVGTTEVTVPEAAAEVTYMQLMGNHERVVDGVVGGTETETWTIRGTDAAGKAFRISVADRYTSQSDITYEASVELADLVYRLSGLRGVTLDEVTAKGVVTTNEATYRVGQVQQRRRGTWVPVSRKAPAVVKAGRRLTMRTVLVGPSGRTYAPTSFIVPKRAKGQRGVVSFAGGGSEYYGYEDEYYEGGSADTLPKVLAQLKARVRNDAVQAGLFFQSERGSIERSRVLGPFNLVVQGERQVRVVVR